ncbi:hypothetical protein D3C75_458890 [compost metagenome]
MTRKNAWTKKEDLVLISLIFQSVNYRTSVAQACAVASIKLDRTYEACKSRWQKQLRKKHSLANLDGDIIDSKNYADYVVNILTQIDTKAN